MSSYGSKILLILLVMKWKYYTSDMIDTNPASLSYIFNICLIFQCSFISNSIVFLLSSSSEPDRSQKRCNGKVLMVTEATNCSFKKRKKFNHHYILRSCIYLPVHALCIFGDGWADHYMKQWSSQKAVIAFTEHFIRGKCSMHQGDLPGTVSCTLYS